MTDVGKQVGRIRRVALSSGQSLFIVGRALVFETDDDLSVLGY